MSKYLHVVAALITKDNYILIAQRPESKYNGAWEFPGGKIESPESPEIALKRELKEELNISANIGAHFMDSILTISPVKTLILSTYFAKTNDIPHALEHQEIKWVLVDELLNYPLLKADVPVAKKLIRTKKADA